MKTTDDVVNRLRAEFLEMPGLRLSSVQAQRLCGIERTLCQTMLEVLVTAKVLCLKTDGTYARLTEGDVPRPDPARAPSPRVSERPVKEA